MIDVQSAIFTEVATKLREKFTGIRVVTALSSDDASLPCVMIEETSNIPVLLDSSDTSKYASLTYTIHVYSNNTKGKMQEARKILCEIDGVLERMNVFRDAYSPIDNIYSNSIYAIAATYGCIARDDGVLFRKR